MLVEWEDRLCVMDTLIYCRFYRDLAELLYLTEVVNAAIGTDYSVEQVKAIGAKIIKMTHDFNAARGIGFAQERLPKWITSRPQADCPS
jgi:aldehyde:ferredoxin oxidoreductase